jgi:cytochrome c oxidase cbb3-type subunit III
MRYTRSVVVVFAVLLNASACQRERRSMRDIPPGATGSSAVQTSEIAAGTKSADPTVGTYQENRFAVSQGQTYYEQFNCAGCHSAGGGGGMGPPLNDDEWIYGSDPENIFDTVTKGRPNGMPSFRGKIGNAHLWQLVAYVRSMSGLTPPDTWPSRSDHMQETRPVRDARPQRQMP